MGRKREEAKERERNVRDFSLQQGGLVNKGESYKLD